jgi:hypothetical protein
MFAGVMLSCIAAPPAVAGDFSVAPDMTGGFGHYTWDIGIAGAAAVANPPLFLARNTSYSFDVNTNSIHPFWIKTVQGPGSSNGYMGGGLSANAVTTSTTITFDVPDTAPETLFYDCSNHAEMTGRIHIVVFRAGFE